ncbi:unnamed protein product, partial [Effrenium voratum]
ECVEAPRAALPCHPGGEQISPQGAQALKALLEQQHREVLARHQELLRKFLYQEEVLRQVLRRQSSSEKCGASFTASQATSDVRVAAALERDPRKPPAIITEESAPTSSRNTAPAGVESARPRTPSSPADAVKAAARRTWGYFRPSVRSDAAPEDSAGTGKTPTGKAEAYAGAAVFMTWNHTGAELAGFKFVVQNEIMPALAQLLAAYSRAAITIA